MKHLVLSLSILLALSSAAHSQLKPLKQLNSSDSGWIVVQTLAASAKNKVEILPADAIAAGKALHQAQVSTASPMGAVIYKTGGILVDDGWIRILGSGHKKLNRSLPGWNKGKSYKKTGEIPMFLLIADDAAGGFFILNGGALGDDIGNVYYLSPNNLEYQPLDFDYSQFIDFCFSGDLDKFYNSLRWKDWKNEVAKLGGNSVFSFSPAPWKNEGDDINNSSRRIIPVGKHYSDVINNNTNLRLYK